MVLDRCFSSAASTSSVVVYLTRNPASATAVLIPISKWLFPVPLSPIKQSGLPSWAYAVDAIVLTAAGEMCGLAAKSKSSSRFGRGHPASRTSRILRRSSRSVTPQPSN